MQEHVIVCMYVLRVSILVLVDDALRHYNRVVWILFNVSILVLVDDALRRYFGQFGLFVHVKFQSLF